MATSPTTMVAGVPRPTCRSPACSRTSSSAGCSNRRWSYGEANSAACRSAKAEKAAITTRTAFLMWMAGGGIRGGTSLGETDDIGYAAAVDPVSVHDIHATILNQLGLDHERLTYKHNGRQYRLTDVAGTVLRQILA